ncbi:MAG: ATP-binding protein, partial [Dehalococcoidia bacterium]
MAEDLYLGKEFEPEDETLGSEFLVDPDDLTTHGLVVGMTGSGKTGFSTVLIEECLCAGVPVLAIDPKGDLANLGFCFETLEASQFEPWMDPVAASRDNRTVAEAAGESASLWRDGLAGWDLGPENLAAYKRGHEFRVLTPGSTAGIPVSLVDSLAAPPADVLDDPEELREQVDGVVSALLGLVRVEADPVSSREYILLHTLIGDAWRRGETLTLEGLIGAVANPPIEKLGALPLETVYPENERRDLMLALNGILASPQLADWRVGEPIDIGRWLRAPDGRPRLSVVYTAHLEDRDRMAVTALVLNRVKSWMRRQPGTGELRCLLYMDEIYGYFPPTANPPTKQPLLTLLKQARAFGVGVLLATQNPVDLDYKGLANMGFWAIGRLQTPQDQNRVREGVEAALEGSDLGFDFDDEIAGVKKRVFLVHDIHRKAPALVHTRWAMSYLRGPVTRDEVGRLADLYGMKPDAPPADAPAPETTSAPGTGRQPAAVPARTHAVPAVAGIESSFWARRGGEVASPHL